MKKSASAMTPKPWRPAAVVEKNQEVLDMHPSRRGCQDAARPDIGGGLGWSPEGRTRAKTEATILGYACACPESTAPTRPSVILDPFAGTGTVPGVAKMLGRHGIGVDLSWDYCRLMRWRIEESGHFAKAEQRTWKEAQGTLI